MGRIYHLKCENGDYEKDLFLGQGMVYPGFNGSYKAAFCKNCNDYTRIMVDLDKNGKIAGKTECCESNEDISVVDDIEANDGLICPKCGGNITVDIVGHWD